MCSNDAIGMRYLSLLFISAGLLSAQSQPLTPEQRGDILMARKMFREAIDTYRKAPQNSAVVWDKIGIAYHQIGDLNAARKAYERSSHFDKKYADPINNLGTLYYAEKKYRTAIARYEKALKLAPESAAVWSNLGTAWYARGKYDEMNKAYARALAIDPEVFEKHGTVGTRMEDRSVQDKARYHYEMARLYAGQGKNDLALQYLRKCLEEGYKERDKWKAVPEFAGLRDTKEYKDLLTLEPRVL